MAEMDSLFNTSGKIPTDSEFWETDLSEFVMGDGITSGFRKVLGEQVFKPLQKPVTPFYNAFAGRPINNGKMWSESTVKKTVANKFNPKASASDDLAFVDSSGVTFDYVIDYAGWRKVSVPSELETMEMFLKSSSIGELNSMLVDNQIMGYQRDMESATQKKVISTTKNKIEVDTSDVVQMIKDINKVVTRMRGDDYHYNDITDELNTQIYTASDDVLIFMSDELYSDITADKSTLRNPDMLIPNGKVIRTPNVLATPITTAEFNAGSGVSGVDWGDVPPVAVDEPAPIMYICSARRCEIRPVINSYKMNMTRNGAGDFDNYHLIWKCGISIRTYENAVRVNAKTDEPTPEPTPEPDTPDTP